MATRRRNGDLPIARLQPGAQRMWIGLLLSLLVAGCGQAHNAQPAARVAGTVTVDHQPLAAGRIQFLPRGAGQPAGAEIAAGQYAALRVPLGPVRVLFTAIKETGRMIQEGGHTFPDRISLIPAAYEAGVNLEVTGDMDHQDFDLVATHGKVAR